MQPRCNALLKAMGICRASPFLFKNFTALFKTFGAPNLIVDSGTR
jgi:hypothetical protein